MVCTGWKNGSYGYGFKISIEDRNSYFKREWKTIILLLSINNQENQVEINIDKESFWNNKCRELINKKIKEWFEAINCINWTKGNIPKFCMENIKDNIFSVKILT